MQEETITLSALTPDPQNARRHSEGNVTLIATALAEVGAARSVVVDEQGRVLAGNATVEAARRAGLTAVQIIETDGQTLIAVRRRGLTDQQKARLALLDNRTEEIGEWDTDALAVLMTAGVSLDDLWTEEEQAALLRTADAALGARNEMPPTDFPAFDETLATEYRCPRCAYEWSGAAKS